MDDGRGRLRKIGAQDYENLRRMREFEARAGLPPKPGIFKVGEVLHINGSRFRVQRITERHLKLRVLPSKAGRQG